MVAAFGTAPDTAYSFVPTRTVVESLDLARPEQPADADQVFWREERFGRGDTISDLLARLGVNDEEARAFLRQVKPGRSLQLLRPGTTVQARTADDGSLLALRYITDKGRLIGFDKQGAEFKAVEQQLALSPQQQMKSGEIRSSLFAATDAAGLSDNVATQLADIFAGDIDFHRDLRRGDKFTVIYEMFYHEGRAIKSGTPARRRIHQPGQELPRGLVPGRRRQGRLLHPGRQEPAQGLPALAAGVFPHQFRLRHALSPDPAPVARAQGHRLRRPGRHPRQGHRGRHGRVCRHGRTATATSSCSSTRAASAPPMPTSAVSPPACARARACSQGDVIGHVGQTGWATGPHLHYEFRVNNEVRNPLTVALPAALPIPSQQMAAFNSVAAPLAAELTCSRIPTSRCSSK